MRASGASLPTAGYSRSCPARPRRRSSGKSSSQPSPTRPGSTRSATTSSAPPTSRARRTSAPRADPAGLPRRLERQADRRAARAHPRAARLRAQREGGAGFRRAPRHGEQPAPISRLGALVAMLGCCAVASPCAFSGDGDALVNALRSRFPEVARFEVTPLSRPVSPAAELEIPGDIGLEKRVQTWVTTIGRDGRAHRTARWWSLKAFAPVMVARRALRAGDPVHPADIAAEERDIAGSGGAALVADPDQKTTG